MKKQGDNKIKNYFVVSLEKTSGRPVVYYTHTLCTMYSYSVRFEKKRLKKATQRTKISIIQHVRCVLTLSRWFPRTLHGQRHLFEYQIDTLVTGPIR